MSHELPSQASQLDLVLRWAEGPDQPTSVASLSDRFELGEGEGGYEAVFTAEGGLVPHAGGERFVWTEERDRAIEAALRQMGEQPRPTVLRQFDEVREALLLGRLDAGAAAALLSELGDYLERQLERWQLRPPVADPGLEEARSAVQHAMLILKDAVMQLLAYAADQEASTMVLAQRLSEQAVHGLERARFSLLASAPAPGGSELASSSSLGFH